MSAWFSLLELIAISNFTFTWENLICFAKDDKEARELLEQILFLFHFYGKEGIELVPCSRWFVVPPFDVVQALNIDEGRETLVALLFGLTLGVCRWTGRRAGKRLKGRWGFFITLRLPALPL